MSRTRRRLRSAMLVALSVVLAVPLSGPASAGSPTRPTYHNAVSDGFSDTFADPSVIQGKDGWWYAYATSDPLVSGGPFGLIHIARTHDRSHWEYLGTAFTDANKPGYLAEGGSLWAPDIRYVDGRYVLYFTVTDTTANAGGDFAIGMATAPTPAGPFTATAAPVVAPRAKPAGGWYATIDPAAFTASNGQRYLYWGSFDGGGWVTQLSADGTAAVGTPVQTTVDNRYEGPYVVAHDGWYYLMMSTANCCAGPTTGYSVYAGRSRSPMGPFVDADGTSLLDPQVGGTPVVHQNGNRFIGVGHHAIATDVTGQSYLVYHGIDRTQPWLRAAFGINRRPMLIDRLDWVDGWPTVRAGAGPSDTDQPAPVSNSLLGITANDPAARGVFGLRQGPIDPDSGATAVVNGAAVTSVLPGGAVRIRMDVRTDSRLDLLVGGGVSVTIDPRAGRLTAWSGRTSASSALPQRAGWSTLVVEASAAGTVRVQLSESDLGDPYAVASAHGARRLPGPLVLLGRGVRIDNLSVQRTAVPVTHRVPVPQPGQLLWSNDFTANTSGLQWVRQNPAASVSGGTLRWPVEGSDLVGTANTAGLLLRDAPAGTWIAETKLTLPMGDGPGGQTLVRNYQQAGMIVRSSDDDFARLGKVSIAATRQTEWARELPDPSPDANGRLAFGGSMVGTAADTIWMRIAHHTNASGEQLYRAATSRDGQHWTWGAVWTFPAGSTQQVGLYAHGGATPAAVASFDYLKLSSGTWPADPGAGS